MCNLSVWPVRVRSLLVGRKLTRAIADLKSDIFSQWTQLGWKAFKPHRWVAFIIFGWGITSTLQSAVTSWAGLMICRVGLESLKPCMALASFSIYLSSARVRSFVQELVCSSPAPHWRMPTVEPQPAAPPRRKPA